MQENTPKLERPMLRMGSVAFLAGIVIFMVSTIGFHAGTRDPMDNPAVFAAYAQSDPWIAAHIGQFAGLMLIYAGGFVALHRLLLHSESGGSTVASALAWFGLAAAIITASTYAILQAVDGVAQKIATSSWYAIPPSSTAGSEEEKAIAFRVAEGIRWTEIGINSYFRMLQGAVAIIF
jgi:nitrate reductase gamma subunit